MKSKKGILIAIAILVIICILLIGIMLLGTSQLSEAEQFVNDFLTAYQEKDPTVGRFLSASVFGNSEMSFEGFQGYIAETLTFTITGERTDVSDPETIWVDVEIENIDVIEIFTELESSNELNPVRMQEQAIEMMNSPDAPRRVFQVSILVMDAQVGMFIQMNEELSDALLGGFPTYISSGLGL